MSGDGESERTKVSVDEALLVLEEFVIRLVSTHAAAFGARIERLESELAEIATARAERDERLQRWQAVGVRTGRQGRRREGETRG